MEDKEIFDRTTPQEWCASLVDLINNDAVSLYEVIGTPLHGFRADRVSAQPLIRKAILTIFEAGGRPVTSSADKKSWQELKRYGSDPERVADAIINEWLLSGRDPDHGDIWFAHKSVIPSV